MANSVDPDETAHYELTHLDLHCLQRYLVWSVGLKGSSGMDTLSGETILPNKFSLLLKKGLP